MGQVSNALPFQFWRINSQTYNEQTNGFVRSRPFIHEWQSGDHIKLQVGYETDLTATYALKAVDRNGDLIDYLPYTKTALIGFNEFDVSFTSDNFNGKDLVSYGLVQFFIVLNNGTLDDETLDSDTLDTWGDGDTVYKTDYIRFSLEIPINEYSGSKVLSYKSIANYASINYPNDGNYFSLRIPCKFFTEREKIIQTSINLTSKVIDTSEFIVNQRWLQIPILPDYMIKKIGVALGHTVRGSLVIDGLEWTRQEAINRSGPGGDIKFPEQMADVWLTEKNSGVRNII